MNLLGAVKRLLRRTLYNATEEKPLKDIIPYLLSEEGMKASREYLLSQNSYFYHNTTRNGLERIQIGGLVPQPISAETNLDERVSTALGLRPSLTCLWASGWQIMRLDPSKKYRLRFQSRYLPLRVIPDASYGDVWSLAQIIWEDRLSHPEKILHEVASRRGSLACLVRIPAEHLDIQLDQSSDPDAAKFEPLSDFNIHALGH
jgi:hypothetical protein